MADDIIKKHLMNCQSNDNNNGDKLKEQRVWDGRGS